MKPAPNIRTSLSALSSAAALAVIGLALGACHEADREPAIGFEPVGSDAAPLACENDQGCPAGNTCDPVTRTCVGCQSDADCPGAHCDAGAHVCVQCVSDRDCGDGVCHPTRHLCVGCWQDDQCDTGVCHPELLACVECTKDRDCGAATANGAGESQRCNLDTFACTGGCASNDQCADRDECTTDTCENGICEYDKIAGCGCHDLERPCPARSSPTDTDQDGCTDACVCDDASLVTPNGHCACTDPLPVCPVGTKLVDSDADGCSDACACPSGAVLGPDGTCPCAATIACEGNFVASDLDGDSCPDTCTKPCVEDCDCAAQGLVADLDCPSACAECSPQVVCADGVCTGFCAVADRALCECPPAPVCGVLQMAVDLDNDGCNESCECIVPPDRSDPATPERCGCPFEVVCAEGSHAIDTGDDGCGDTCTCDDATKVQAPDGACCKVLECPAGSTPSDIGGTLCADVCMCPNGHAARNEAPHCECVEKTDCPEGATPIDDDHDGCADRCVCDSGEAPGANGCEPCFDTCTDVETLPPYALFVDEDKDGCYDLVDACPIGTQAVMPPGSGCPDVCESCHEVPVCPTRSDAVDTNADNCPDECHCADGSKAPEHGCGCAHTVECTAPSVPVDRDKDGCADDCVLTCTSACDCTGAAALETDTQPSCATDCADCNIAGSCVEGFCSFACSAGGVAVVACPVSPEPSAAVCGCDGNTYPTACDAQKAGTAVKRDGGGCDTGGCLSDQDCKDAELCELPSGQCPSVTGADISAESPRGECVERPVACLDSASLVCGCDGKTYTNDCERRRAGVARASTGECH